ncbi:MAG: hypothetical protein AVDCRST_MAG33-3453 [uncultured Thermomicrobiales bacterium]|uniref:Uncharacterized protein n=1 Tax=uncultured Thermomicrobiales bacterium TaxID=1645740 RepID=A0A6J4VLU3_9BACT|nr:MAG: hypothetical protein AVDCRST_MAG33-3453 [uncultured Thermomicrobiales bacterium]
MSIDRSTGPAGEEPQREPCRQSGPPRGQAGGLLPASPAPIVTGSGFTTAGLRWTPDH